MQLPLRYYLILSLLLGAVAIPLAWRSIQQSRAAKIEKLEKELREACDILSTLQQLQRVHARSGKRNPQTDQAARNMTGRVEELVFRLEKMTGVAPQRPESRATYEPMGNSGSDTQFWEPLRDPPPNRR